MEDVVDSGRLLEIVKDDIENESLQDSHYAQSEGRYQNEKERDKQVKESVALKANRSQSMRQRTKRKKGTLK